MFPSTSNNPGPSPPNGFSDWDISFDHEAVLGIEQTQLISPDSSQQREQDDWMVDNDVETESLNGLESTQLMSQGSVRKRDKKKNKQLAKNERNARRRMAESQEQTVARNEKNSKQMAESRSSVPKKLKSRRNQIVSTKTAERRSIQTPEEKKLESQANAERMKSVTSNESPERKIRRTQFNAERMAFRRSVEPEEVRRERNKKNAERTATSRNNETNEQTSARRDADRIRRGRPSTLIGVAGTDKLPEKHYFGKMDNVCRHCGALYFQCETTTRGKFTVCCLDGAVKPEQKEGFPSELKKLFMANKNFENQVLWNEAKNFQENIRNYNNSLAMASMSANIKMPTGGPYCFRVHKQVYHFVGSSHPTVPHERNFAQVLFLDTEQAAAELAGRKMNDSCSEELFKKLIEILRNHHPHAKGFRMMYEMEEKERKRAEKEKREGKRVTMVLQARKDQDKNRYQESTANEVAVVYVGDEEEIPGKRETIVQQRSGNLRAMHVTDKNCDPMSYPLLFPTGQFGWHPNIGYVRSRGKRVRVTMREFYCFNLHVRNTFSPLFRAGKLFQQFVVDIWTRVEQNRLDYIRKNQNLLRVEPLNGLQDYVNGEEKGPVGARIRLPASHTGSPRDMVQQYQDAMTVVSRYGKPDFFLTMTCNPKWQEIQECLYTGQTATDRPDIVARVFNMKLEELKTDLFKRNILGDVLAYIYVIEFQKRGLPHVHMLLIMKPGYKPRTAADVDKYISAQLPDKDKNPELYKLVTSLMMHRACGVHDPKSPCMRDGKCSKGYPKEFREKTSTDNDGYSLYKRSNDGKFFEYEKEGQTIRLTNQHVVPHNAYLIMKYQCHINLEVCGAMSSVKYLYKYVYKGTTRASVVITVQKDGKEEQVIDEIKQYLDTRFVCAPEAMHHLYEFAMSYRSVTVLQLTVHLPGENSVVFEMGEEEEAVRRAEVKKTKLEAWFEKNKESQNAVLPNGKFPDGKRDSREYFYYQMPEFFTYNSSNEWQQRANKQFAIGRMYFISPKNPERYALRQILLYRKGATSFEDLRTVDGIQYPNFVEAARAAGYMSDDKAHEQTLREAANFQSAQQLRGLFVTLMVFEIVNNAEELWKM